VDDGKGVPAHGAGIAVILAAGMGRRLRGTLGDLPKGLLEVGGVSLLERSLKALRSCGVGRVVLVTGHGAGSYDRFLADRFPDVETCCNPEYERAGSMRSLRAARGLVAEPFLLLESDLLYEPRALTEMQERPAGSWLLVSGPTGQGDEVYAYGPPGRLALLSKERPPGTEPQGEFVGISRLTPALFEAMCRRHDEVAGVRACYEYDDCLSDLSASQAVCVHLVEDLVWAEIDDDAQHRRAVERVLPAL